MKLTREQVRHVASLARLELTEEETARALTQLQAVLDAVDTLSSVDTTGIPPTSYVVQVAPTTRDDVPGGMLSTDDALKNAPRTVDTSFAIPRVIE